MLKNKKKKAFTIVELVIVIAVIAVLASVLVPTFANLIGKANQSADIQATRQMNMALAAGSIPDAPENFVDVIEILADAGFNSETCLIPVTKGYRFYWTGPEYNTIVLAQVPAELLGDEPQAQTFSLARSVTAESLGIKVICPTEDEELVAAVEEALVALYNYIKNSIALPEDFALFDLADGKEALEAILGGKTPVSSVTLGSTSVELETGRTTALTATVAPEDATDKTVTWTSSDENVATVADGVVTAVAPGTAVITAKSGSASATCVVTVAEAVIPVSGVTLSQSTVTVLTESSATLTATVAPEDATNKTVTWTSSDENVATVDENGTVAAKGNGIATITATAGDKSATCEVIVPHDTLNHETLKLSLGGSCGLYLWDYSNGEWNSSNENVVTLTKNGDYSEYYECDYYDVKAVGTGETIITFISEDRNYAAYCIVTVVETLEVTTNDELLEALSYGGNIKLMSNDGGYEENEYRAIDIIQDTVLDLNDQTFKLVSSAGDTGLDVNANLTIKNGTLTLTGEADSYAPLYVAPGGKLTLDDVVVKHPDKLCLMNYGTATITNCTFETTGAWWPDTIVNGYSGSVEQYNAVLNISKTTIDATAAADNNGTPMSSNPVVKNAYGSTINFGENVTIKGYLTNDGAGGVFLNKGTVNGSYTLFENYLNP